MKLVGFLGYIPTCLAKIVSDLEILRSDESCGSYYLFLRLDFFSFPFFGSNLKYLMVS